MTTSLMRPELRALLLERLLLVRQAVAAREYPRKGICWELRGLPQVVHWHADRLMRRWPGYSGDTVFPVPGPGAYSPYYAYQGTPEYKFFVGEYGASRIRLLEFMIKELQE